MLQPYRIRPRNQSVEQDDGDDGDKKSRNGATKPAVVFARGRTEYSLDRVKRG